MGKQTIVYIADPMCSWCWGFSPVVHTLRREFGHELDFEVLMGGLRVGSRPLDAGLRSYLIKAWSKIHEMTGQPFCMDFDFGDGFVYNTEPACRAVVAFQQLTGRSGLEYLTALQEAFYARNQDITLASVQTQIAESLGVAASEFELALGSDACHAETHRQFDTVFEFGIQGFPSMIGFGTQRPRMLSHGYVEYSVIKNAVENWLAR